MATLETAANYGAASGDSTVEEKLVIEDPRHVTQPPTPAARLERDLLLHRAQRIERVLAALKDRAVYRDAVDGTTPAPLKTAIADFQIELGRLRRRLSELPG